MTAAGGIDDEGETSTTPNACELPGEDVLVDARVEVVRTATSTGGKTRAFSSKNGLPKRWTTSACLAEFGTGPATTATSVRATITATTSGTATTTTVAIVEHCEDYHFVKGAYLCPHVSCYVASCDHITTTTTARVQRRPPPLGASGVSGNTYQGVKRFVSADYVAKVDGSIKPTLPTPPSPLLSCACSSRSTVVLRSLSNWLSMISLVVTVLLLWLPTASFQLVPSPATTDYIDVIAKISRQSPPTPSSSSVTQSEYPDGVAYAIANLCKIPNTYCYVDAAHSGWLGWADNSQKMVAVIQNVLSRTNSYNSAAAIGGFATSDSNYSPFDAKNIDVSLHAGGVERRMENSVFGVVELQYVDETVAARNVHVHYEVHELATHIAVSREPSGLECLRIVSRPLPEQNLNAVDDLLRKLKGHRGLVAE
ncbi:hypothetical protein BJ742DRAFT_777569 [Cladochytrium replicatum]|nr:hypothetical protein BJ742DRAFT_777569 [Cladochytrium replicatum]